MMKAKGKENCNDKLSETSVQKDDDESDGLLEDEDLLISELNNGDKESENLNKDTVLGKRIKPDDSESDKGLSKRQKSDHV